MRSFPAKPVTVATAFLVLLCGCGSGTNFTMGPSPPPTPSIGPLLVVSDWDTGAISVLEANPSSGNLSLVSSQAGPGCAQRIAADPQGQFVVAAGCDHLRSYKVDKAKGDLSANSESVTYTQVPGGRTVLKLAVAGRLGYLVSKRNTLDGHSSTGQFSLDPTSGVLAGLSNAFPSPHSDVNFTIPAPPEGRFVYSSDWSGHIYSSTLQPDGSLVDTGAVDLQADTSFAEAALGPDFLAVLTGYTVDGPPGGLLTLAIDPNSGLLTPRQIVQGRNYASGWVAVSSVGLIAHWFGPVETWSVNATGTLTLRGSLPIPAGYGRGLAFDPTGRFLYVSDSANGITVLGVDASGALRVLFTYPSTSGSIAVIRR
jgi:6-phosphogluconolactonase (cycloisomerase 2 family)